MSLKKFSQRLLFKNFQGYLGRTKKTLLVPDNFDEKSNRNSQGEGPSPFVGDL